MDNFTKITTGWVTQYFRPNEDGMSVCTSQKFTAGDIVEYEDDYQEPIKPQDDYEYQPFDMEQPESVQHQKALLEAAQEVVSDFDNYGEVLQTGFDGGYGKDTAIYKLGIAVNRIENNGG